MRQVTWASCLRRCPVTATVERPGVWVWRLAVGLMLVALLLPLLLVPIPPVVDYPNHLARAYVLGLGQHDPVLSTMYAPHWGLIPNLVVDLLLPPLVSLLPLDIAGRLVLAGSLLLPICGTLVYSRTLFGRWSWWPLASGLVAFNLGFLFGFMSFLLGIGAAFLVAAGWLRFHPRYPLMTLFAATFGAVVVYFCHLIALVLLGTLVLAGELETIGSREERDSKPSLGPASLRLAAVIAVFVPSVVLFAFSPTFATVSGPTVWARLPLKLWFILTPLLNYIPALDIGTGSLLAAFIVAGLKKRWLVMPPSTIIAFFVLAYLFGLSPFRLKGGSFFDVRFAIMVGYVLFAGITESRLLPRRVAVTAGVCLAALLFVRVGAVALVWGESRQEIAEMRAATQAVPPGARVLVVAVRPEDAPAEYWRKLPLVRSIDGLVETDYNLPALFLVERRAFSPILDTDPSQWPIAVLPPYNKLAPPAQYQVWGLPHCSLLEPTEPERAALENRPYLAGWTTRFDEVMILNPSAVPDCILRLADRLQLAEWTPSVARYRVRRQTDPHPADGK